MRLCLACRGYELERQWCSFCKGAGVVTEDKCLNDVAREAMKFENRQMVPVRKFPATTEAGQP